MPPHVWHDDIPPDCPPDDATRPNGDIYYRLIRSAPPSNDDFLTFYEEGKGNKCRHHGLSVSRDKDGLLRYRDTVKGRRNNRVARARIPDEYGLVKYTRSRNISLHYTWWVPRDCQGRIASLFTVTGD